MPLNKETKLYQRLFVVSTLVFTNQKGLNLHGIVTKMLDYDIVVAGLNSNDAIMSIFGLITLGKVWTALFIS